MSNESRTSLELELQRIQKECVSMIKSLKVLHEEEIDLRSSNKFLAHRAALMGCTAGLDGGARRGAQRKAAAKKAVATSAGSNGRNSMDSGDLTEVSKIEKQDQMQKIFEEPSTGNNVKI